VTTGLYIHDCSLTVIHPETLAPLKNTLRYLWLNSNEFVQLDEQLRELFSKLLHLRLASNSLGCDCASIWLKEFYDKNSAVFKGATGPSCHAPLKLKGKQFSQLSLFDFRCRVPMFSSVDVHMPVSGQQPGRLRCVANGLPSPVIYWIQPSGKTTKFNPSQDEDADTNDASLLLPYPAMNKDGDSVKENTEEDEGFSNLNGMYICFANNDAGNITLTMNVPWPNTAIRVFPWSKTTNGSKFGETSISVNQSRSSISILKDYIKDSTTVISLLESVKYDKSHRQINGGSTTSVSHIGHDIFFTHINYTHLEREPHEQQHLDLIGTQFTLNQFVSAILITHVTTLVISATVAFAVVWCRTHRTASGSQNKSSAVSGRETDDVSSCVRSMTEAMYEVENSCGGEKSSFGYPTCVVTENVYLNDKRYPPCRSYMTSPILR